jgi:predicted NBD/HSP70 family sugar kinase
VQPVSAVPANLRLANQAALLGQLLAGKTASRAELAKATGMSKPTTGKIIEDLVRAGVVEEIDVTGLSRPSVGRPGKQLRLATERPRFVVVDLGVEMTRLSGLAPAPPDQERWEVQFKTPSKAEVWQEKLTECVEELSVRRPWAVLISTPGVVDERAGRVLLSSNLHWSEQADLPKILGQIWSAPVSLVQEVRCLALGELGWRSDRDDFVMIDIADGVGGALMLAGRLFQGGLPMSGEIGHIPIPGNSRLCGCGGRGCLETLASQRGMIQSLREAMGYSARHPLTFADVVKAADGDLPTWMRATFDAIATCVSGALNLYGVRRAVMVGRITELPGPATSYLIDVIQRGSMWSRFENVSVTLAPKRISRGLVIAGIHRFVMPTDWSAG